MKSEVLFKICSSLSVFFYNLIIAVERTDKTVVVDSAWSDIDWLDKGLQPIEQSSNQIRYFSLVNVYLTENKALMLRWYWSQYQFLSRFEFSPIGFLDSEGEGVEDIGKGLDVLVNRNNDSLRHIDWGCVSINALQTLRCLRNLEELRYVVGQQFSLRSTPDYEPGRWYSLSTLFLTFSAKEGNNSQIMSLLAKDSLPVLSSFSLVCASFLKGLDTFLRNTTSITRLSLHIQCFGHRDTIPSLPHVSYLAFFTGWTRNIVGGCQTGVTTIKLFGINLRALVSGSTLVAELVYLQETLKVLSEERWVPSLREIVIHNLCLDIMRRRFYDDQLVLELARAAGIASKMDVVLKAEGGEEIPTDGDLIRVILNAE